MVPGDLQNRADFRWRIETYLPPPVGISCRALPGAALLGGKPIAIDCASGNKVWRGARSGDPGIAQRDACGAGAAGWAEKRDPADAADANGMGKD